MRRAVAIKTGFRCPQVSHASDPLTPLRTARIMIPRRGRAPPMGIPLSDEIKKLLDQPNFAHLATLLPDGSPQSAPVWVACEGGRVLERRPDGDFKGLDAISRKYTGQPFPFRNPDGRVVLVIEVDKARYTKLPLKHTPPK